MDHDNEFSFDFDHWAKLAKEQPEEFEKQRQAVIDHIITDTPTELKPRMQGLQWQIDQLRRQAKTPMAACIKISSMMWDTVLGEDGLLEALEKLNSPESLHTGTKAPAATILTFGREQPETKES